ncbi:MAG: DUF5683 domain-containing protein [Pseudomonadota bacterium]
MKHQLRAALCSALILPGVGQILNRQISKALVMIGVMTGLLVVFIIKLVSVFSIVMGVMFNPQQAAETGRLPAEAAAKYAADVRVLFIVVGLGLGLWVYSVVDAYLYGRRLGTAEERKVN